MPLTKLNIELRELSFWLNANKIALNIAKRHFFHTNNKSYDAELKIKLLRKQECKIM